MATTAYSGARTTGAAVWTGRVLSALAAIFLTLDAASHLAKPAPVVQSFQQLGIPLGMSVPIGVIALVCVAVYVIPRTAIVGAVLLTGYLGGAIAVQARAGATWFPTLFPLIVAALVWGGLWLRDARVKAGLAGR